MSNKVQKALEERKKRQQETSRASTERVNAALESRKKRIEINAPNIIAEIQKQYNSEIESFKSFTSNNKYNENSDKWGKDIDVYGIELEKKTRENDILKLKTRIEAYRKYLGDSTADKILNNLNSVSEGYNSILTNANILSKFKSKDEYDKSVKAQEDYEAMVKFDLEKGQKEISDLETRLKNMPTPSYDARGSTGQANAESARKAKRDLEAKIAEKKAYYTRAKRIQDGIKLTNDATNATDFKEKSQYIDNVSYGLGGKPRFEDETYAYINNPTVEDKRLGGGKTTARSIIEGTNVIYNLDNPWSDGESSSEENALDYLTDDEVAIYNYYYATGGKKKAEEYLDNIQETIRYRKAKEDFGKIEGKTIAELLFSIEAGVDQFSSGMQNLFNTEDDYIDPTVTQMVSGMVREDLADDSIPMWYNFKEGKWEDKVFGNSLGQVGYDLTNTTANMLPSILTSTAIGFINPTAGAVFGAGLLGASASGNAYAEMLNLGYDKGQARLYSGLVGLSEASLQYLLGGIGKLGGGTLTTKAFVGIANNMDNAFARVAIKLGGNALGEFTEEYLQEVLNPFFKNLTLNTNEDIKLFSTEALYSGMLGALSAGVLEGGSTISSDIRTTNLGKNVQSIDGGVQRLKELGTTFAADTVAYQIADKVTKETGAYKIGLLLQEVGGTLSEQNVSDIVTELTKKGMDEKSAKTIAKSYQAFLNGEMSLTDEQVEVLEGLDPLADVLRKSIIGRNTSVYQRTREYDDLVKLASNIIGNPNTESTPDATIDDTSAKGVVSPVYSSEYVDSVVKEFEAMGIPTESARILAEKKLSVSTEGNSTPTEENIVESEFEVSAEGKTINKKNDKIVNIKNIESISEDGEVKVTLDDKMVVKASDLAFGSEAEAIIIENIGKIKLGKNPISTTSANALLMKAMSALEKNPNMTANEAMYLVKGLEESYVYGAYNLGRSKLTSRNEDGSARLFAGELSQDQRKYAYDLGTKDIISKTEADQKVIDDLKAKAEGKPTKKSLGKVIFEKGAKVDESALTETQKANLDGIKLLAELSSVEFHVFRSDKVGKTFKYTMPDGTVVTANGWFVAGTNQIWVDLNAGNAGEGTMIRTAAHEISHYIKQWSPKKWRAMADYLMKSFAENGVDTESMLNRQIAKIKRRYTKKNMPAESVLKDMAYEELVSDALTDMLTDGSIVNFLAEVKAKDRNLWNKIKDAINSLLKKWGLIVEDYKGRDLDTAEAKALSQLEDTFKKLQEMYQDAFIDANETVAMVNDIANIDADSKSVSPMMSERTWTESEYVTEREKTAKAISSTLGVDIDTAYKYIDDINSVAKLIADDRVRLDYEPNIDENATVLKKNSEYKYSVDMSTLCAKRLLTTGTFDAIQRRLPNTVFSSEDIVALREMMLERGYEVACGICYVESTRREMGRITQNFINSYIESQKTGKPITRTNSKGKIVDLKKTKDEMLTTADKSADKFYADKNYTPTLADLNTTDIDLVKKEHPLVYEAYLNFMNARGQAKPKLLETRAEYKGEILKHFKTKKTLKARNDAGGLRLQSFSDFEVPHLIDMMQIIMDMSRVGLKSQAYTKVPAFAEVFGNTGVKINLSLIAKGSGLDANGSLIFDDVEGIDHKEAFKLRDKFSKNVGTILVGKNDAHIIAAMADPRIDYIIPFHKSSWKESLYEALGLTGYADYTDFQNEKSIDGSEISNYDPSEYWDFTKSGDENAQIYLEKCRKDGRIPKFPQFQGYPGYWKLLIDFKMYDNDGVGSPQEVVNPTFEMDAANKILDEYKGGHRNFPVAKDVVEDFVKNYEESVKFSERDYSYDALVSKPDMLITAVNDKVTYKPTKTIRKNIVNQAIKNAIPFGKTNENGNVIIHVDDINTDVLLSKNSLVHGLDRRLEISAPVILNIGSVLKNSIRINELKPKQESATGSYVLIGYAESIDYAYPVRMIVNQYTNEVDTIDVLHAVHTKKETAGKKPGSHGKAALPTVSTISISNLLDFVNNNFPDVLPEGVWKHYKHTERPKGYFSESVLFSERDSEGNELSKGQQEFFKDSKVRDSEGNLTPVYHGTPSGGFTEFQLPHYLSTLTAAQGAGYYFTDKKNAQQYMKGLNGKSVSKKELYKVYLNITNPLEISEYSTGAISDDAFRRVMARGNYEWGMSHTDVEKRLQVSKFDSDRLAEMVRVFNGDEILTVMKEELGYDGVHFTDKYGDIWVAWDKSQIKNTTNENPTTNPDIRYSERDVAPITEEDTKKMVKHFGTTTNYEVAGYMLKNGKMLDFSGKHWGDDYSTSRQVDHRDIQEVLDDRGNNGVDAMIDMISNGNIRLMPETGGINLAVMPNESQIKQLRGYINHFRGEVIIDVDAVGGDTIHSWEYNKGTSSAKILSDIKAYFEKGTIPQQQSSLNQFLYSERDLAPTFYSQMGKVVEGVKQEKLAANSVVNMLRGKGVKAEEIRWSGIVPFLEGKKSVTKQELLDFINGSMLQIEEETRQDGKVKLKNASRNAKKLYVDGDLVETFQYNEDEGGWSPESNPDDIYYLESDIVENYAPEHGNIAKWSQYKLEGGKNYKELVFKMPDSSYTNGAMRVHFGENAKGILVHARIQDFKTKKGKMLFIEEIQSDWHNEGHKSGYRAEGVEDKETLSRKMDAYLSEFFKSDIAKVIEKRISAIGYEGAGISNILNFLIDSEATMESTLQMLERKGATFSENEVSEIRRYAIGYEKLYQKWGKAPGHFTAPDAPFKDNYHEYVLKRLIRMAAEQGYDSIGWTPADIQSDRWSDEFAEGYRIEYDQDMPKFLKKYGRQWGAKVETTSIPKQTVNGRERILKETELKNVKRDLESEKRNLARHYDSYERAFIQRSIEKMEKTIATLEKELSASLNIWSMSITDSMKNSVLYEGQAMYSERDPDSSNRAILANALEGAAQNDIERNKLAQYKEKISLIESEEKRLSEIQKQLFTKGAVEPEQRKDLQFEARQIANRITTYDRQLLNLESTTALKNVLNREKALAMKRQKQKDNEKLKQYKEKVAKTQRELLERHKESRKNAIESRERTAMRHKVQKVVGDLNNLLLKPTKERHVPEEMKIAVAEALAIVNMDTVDAETRVAHYNDLISKATDPDVIASLTETRDRILNQGNKLADKLTKLKDAYGMVRDSTDDSLRSMYDDVIYNKIESVQRLVGKTPLRNMTLGQLESVYELYKMVLTTVRDSNRAFAENLKMTRLALGSNTFAEIKENNKARNTIGKTREFVEKFGWQNLKPMQAMKTIGSGTLQKLWNNILYGQEVFAVDYDEAVKFAKEMKDKYGYKKWNLNKLYSFESKSGKTMKLNLEQMMSIYAYSKRPQADDHIEYGGIVLNEGIIKEKNKLGKTVEVKVNDSTAYRLNKMQIGEIVSTLEKEFPGAKDFVDEMQKYLSETMGAKGNEVSMKMYGINLFKEEHYFPLKSSKDFMEAANAKLKGDVKIKNKGMTKSTVEHARNPIVLENFLDVWGNHINEMAMYHGLVLPLEDFSRTLNYSYKADESLNTDAESVRTALHDAFGESADNYLNELLKAINGGVLHDSSAAIADKMISKFKKAKVMASLSVIVQQPTAIIRSMAIIDPKYFVAQNIHHKKTWEELKKYCPTAIIKETGSFDTNMGRTIVDMVKDDQGFIDKVGDVLGKAPAFMDEVGWNMIWRALKKKVAIEQKLSGEELLQECGKQMTLILNETQVYDSVMSRNELMRSKNALTKMATAFMAEPSTVANMMYGAALDFKRGKKGMATKTVAATITSVVINGLVSSLVYAMRDDDEEKTWLEKYLSSATTEVLDGLNPLTYIPFVKDAYSLFQGYKVERTDMALISDVVDAINNFYKVLNPSEYEGMSKGEIAKHIYENSVPMLTSICDMFGLPVGNILRDAKAIIIQDNVPLSQASSKGMGYALKEGVLSALPKVVSNIIGTDSKQDKLYDAIVDGDTAYVDRLKSGYKDDKAYETAVRKALRENDPRIKEAAEARIGGNIAEYTRIVKEIKAEGHFSQDTIVASVNAEINAINKGESTSSESSSENKASSMYKIEDYYDSVVGGDQASAYVVKEDMINTEVTNGKDREEAETSFNSRFASYVREQYEEGYIAEDEAQRLLVNYGDKSEEEADSKVQYWAFKQEYPDYDDLSEEAVAKYYKDVEPHGISIDVYYDYSEQRSKCKGTDNNGDGKTDSGSKKAEILQVINSLPLSSSQKDALYYLNGWSAKTIYEAPWH